MNKATQPDAIRCQAVRSCGSNGRKGREGQGKEAPGWVAAVAAVAEVVMICYDHRLGVKCVMAKGLGVDRMTRKIKPGARQHQPNPGVAELWNSTRAGELAGQRVNGSMGLEY